MHFELSLLTMALLAQDPAPPPPTAPPAPASSTQDEPASPATPQEFESRLEADGIRLDLARKEVRLRGDLLRRRRQQQYPIEYGLVVEGGATHEAFGIVKCTPSLLNACFLALGLEPGVPRRRVLKTPLPPEEEIEVGLTEPWEVLPPSGDRVFLYVVWEEDGKPVVRALEDFFVDLRSMKPLPMRGFVYLGSRFEELQIGAERKRVYLADYEGNVVSIHPDKKRAENSLFDVFSFDDEPYVWADVDSERLPPDGVALEFVFTLLPRADARPFEPEPPIVPIPLPSARELAAKSKNPALDGTNDSWLDRLGTRELHDLVGIMHRARPPLRELAAEVLGASRRAEAVEPITLTLRYDRTPEVRLAAAYALVEIGSPEAFEALIKVLEQGAPEPQKDALTALRFASGEDFGTKPLGWREWVRTRVATRR